MTRRQCECGISLEGEHPNRKRCIPCAKARLEKLDRTRRGIPLAQDAVTCPVCKRKMNIIPPAHFQKHGFKTAEVFRQAFHLRVLEAPSLTKKRADYMKTNSPTKGRARTVEERQRMSKARKGKGIGVSGKYERTPEIRSKISAGVAKFHRENPHRMLKSFKAQRLEVDVCAPSVWVRSSWEARVLHLLDRHPEVEHVRVEPCAIPYEFEGVRRHYIPDFQVEFACGIKEMWEVKPQEFLGNPKVKAKIEALNRYVDEHEMNARIVTLKDIEAMERKVSLFAATEA